VLPNGVAPYESVQSLLVTILAFLGKCLNVADYECILLATFVVATWFIDRLPVAPYVALVGLSGSGKRCSASGGDAGLEDLCRRKRGPQGDVTPLTRFRKNARFPQLCPTMPGHVLFFRCATKERAAPLIAMRTVSQSVGCITGERPTRAHHG
jgi:hypothetical protein